LVKTSQSKQHAELKKKQKNMEPIGMVLIPAGEFQMGSEEGNFDEKPIHKVSTWNTKRKK